MSRRDGTPVRGLLRMNGRDLMRIKKDTPPVAPEEPADGETLPGMPEDGADPFAGVLAAAEEPNPAEIEDAPSDAASNRATADPASPTPVDHLLTKPAHLIRIFDPAVSLII
jgi:hypothetical protein